MSKEDVTSSSLSSEIGKELPDKYQWQWIKRSVLHEEKLLKLQKIYQKDNEKIRVINGVKMCFKPEFHIGEGSRGTFVYIGLGKDGCEKAVKRIPKVACALLAETEREIMNSQNAVTSKNILRYCDYDDESDDEFVYLIVNLCEENLKQFVERESQEKLIEVAPGIIRQILQGLEDLHRPQPNPVLHRDLKPSNILRDVHGTWLLADFGISRTLLEDETTYRSEQCGTVYWRAVESYPESGRTKSDCGKVRYKKQSDIQVAGMLCHYILTKGKHPFGPEADRVRNLLNGKPVGLDDLEDIAAKDLIEWMVQRAPKDRPSAQEALNHPYLQTHGRQFELLERVGNQLEIKSKSNSCVIVQELNRLTGDWQSQMDPVALHYLCQDGRKVVKYGKEWTECLRLMRNISMHWNDRPRPRPKIHEDLGEPKDFFLKTFPTLSVDVHRVIRVHFDWKERCDLKKLF